MDFSQAFHQCVSSEQLMIIQQRFYLTACTDNQVIDYALGVFKDKDGITQMIEIVASTDSDQTNVVIYLIDALGMSETINLEKMLNIITLAKMKPLPSIVVD